MLSHCKVNKLFSLDAILNFDAMSFVITLKLAPRVASVSGTFQQGRYRVDVLPKVRHRLRLERAGATKDRERVETEYDA